MYIICFNGQEVPLCWSYHSMLIDFEHCRHGRTRYVYFAYMDVEQHDQVKNGWYSSARLKYSSDIQ